MILFKLHTSKDKEQFCKIKFFLFLNGDAQNILKLLKRPEK